MKLINTLDRYLFEKDYKIIITNDCLNINNYDEIIDFSLTKIIIRCQNKKIIIEGRNLIITKMLDNEVLIKGTITNLNIN